MNTEKQISLDYQITGSGWSTCLVVIKGEGCETTASYLGDALGDLLEAILALKRGAKTSRCSFQEEPGEYRWIFESFGHLVRVKLLWFTWSDFYPDEQGELKLKGVIRKDLLIEEAIRMARECLSTYGMEGYKKRWVAYDFPLQILQDLEEPGMNQTYMNEEA